MTLQSFPHADYFLICLKVGTLEGANFLKTGELVRFSQQALMDCSWGFGNNACDGGEGKEICIFTCLGENILHFDREQRPKRGFVIVVGTF